MKISRGLGVSLATLSFMLSLTGLALAYGASEASASPSIEVGTLGGFTARTAGTEYVASTEQTTQMYLLCEGTPGKAGRVEALLFLGTAAVGTFTHQAAVETPESDTLTLVIPAAAKWHYTATNATCSSRYQELKATSVPGPEGKEGKEGKEGPAGKEGPKGETGLAGPSGKSEVTGFGSGAEATFSEGIGQMETIGWCIIGTMLACAVGFFTWRLIGSP